MSAVTDNFEVRFQLDIGKGITVKFAGIELQHKFLGGRLPYVRRRGQRGLTEPFHG